MTLIKNITKTIFILLGILVLICAFAFAIMMIFHVSIFGYTYVSASKTCDPITISAEDMNNLTDINVKTSNLKIIVKYNENGDTEKGTITAVLKYNGIVKSEVAKYGYVDPNDATNTNYTPKVVDGVLDIVTREHEGLYLNNNSFITISIPATKTVNLKVDSEIAVDIGCGNAFAVNDLDITSNKKLLNSGMITNDKLIINGDLSIKTNYGKVIINSQLNGDVNIDSLAGFVQINSSIPTGHNLTIKGTSPVVYVGNFPDKVDSNSDYDFSGMTKYDIGGQLVVEDCTGASIVKVFGKIGNGASLSSETIKFWTIDIDKGLDCVYGANELKIFGTIEGNSKCTINNKDGFLFIKDCKVDLDITSAKGGVKILNAYSNIWVNNTNSDTNINYASSVSGKTLEVVNVNGNVIATNISGKVKLISKSGKVTAQFRTVSGNENIISSKSTASVTVVDNIPFNLDISTISGDVSLNFGSVKRNSWGTANTDYVIEGKIANDYILSDGNYKKSTDIEINGGNVASKISIITVDGKIVGQFAE